jgi:hypothetical protein
MSIFAETSREAGVESFDSCAEGGILSGFLSDLHAYPHGESLLMHALLAYADSSDPTLSNLQTIVGAVFIVLATLVLAAVLIFISRSRRHRQAESILVAAFFWACITAGSLIYAEQSQLNWSREYRVRVESGYYDPNNTADAPELPWALWSALAVAYAAMLWWAMSKKGKRTANPKTPGE